MAARFTASREYRKMKQDKATAIEQRFFPVRFESYGKFLTKYRATHADMHGFHEEGGDIDRFFGSFQELQQIRADLDLASPGTSTQVREALQALQGAFFHLAHNDDLPEEADRKRSAAEEVQRTITLCEADMRRGLGLDERDAPHAVGGSSSAA